MNRAALEQPFPSSCVRTRAGAFGKSLRYVEGHQYIRRLNDAFDGDWSWEVLHHEVHRSEVVVLGVLEAGGVRKHAFGGAVVTTSTNSGESVSLADDFKAAATDALKKACSLLGVGLELYEGEEPRGRAGQPQPRRETNGPSGHPGRSRLTAKQLRALYAISHSKRMTEHALKALSLERFGVAPEFLDKQQASSLIDELNER